jgi:hypothetical protein
VFLTPLRLNELLRGGLSGMSERVEKQASHSRRWPFHTNDPRIGWNSALWLRVVAAALEVDADVRRVADYPGVMPRRNRRHVSRADLHF